MKTRNFIPFEYRKRQGKYNAQTQTVDGISFHSKKEAQYYGQLKLEKRCGMIKDFQRQVTFDLFALTDVDSPENYDCKRVCTHIVDFLVTLPEGLQEVREVKGFATDVWDLKRKIFEANYPQIPYKVIR